MSKLMTQIEPIYFCRCTKGVDKKSKTNQQSNICDMHYQNSRAYLQKITDRIPDRVSETKNVRQNSNNAQRYSV